MAYWKMAEALQKQTASVDKVHYYFKTALQHFDKANHAGIILYYPYQKCLVLKEKKTDRWCR